MTELILEHLKAIRKDIAKLQESVSEVKLSLVSVRQDIHGVRSDGMRFERGIARLELDIEQIQKRLELGDES